MNAKRLWLWRRTDWPDDKGILVNDEQQHEQLVRDHGHDPNQEFTELFALTDEERDMISYALQFVNLDFDEDGDEPYSEADEPRFLALAERINP